MKRFSAAVSTPVGPRFSFRYTSPLRRARGRRKETRHQSRSDVERKGERERDRKGLEKGEKNRAERRRRKGWVSIESVSSPQLQLNRTCRREVHLAVSLVSSRFRPCHRQAPTAHDSLRPRGTTSWRRRAITVAEPTSAEREIAAERIFASNPRAPTRGKPIPKLPLGQRISRALMHSCIRTDCTRNIRIRTSLGVFP